MSSVIVRVDDKGRIMLPKRVRESHKIKPGSRVLVEPRGEGELVVRLLDKDPSEELEELLGGFEFSRRDRVRAEKLLLEEAGLGSASRGD